MLSKIDVIRDTKVEDAMAKSLAVWVGNVEQVNFERDVDKVISPEPENNKSSKKKSASPSSKAVPSELELHFNYWSFLPNHRKEDVNYLDVGVHFNNITDDLNLFFPFYLSKDDIDCSLGRTVCNNVDILSAIFNSSVLSLDYLEVPQTYAVVKTKNSKGDESSFNFYLNFDIGELANNVKLRTFNGGSIITFPYSCFGKSSGLNYLRFRVYLNEKSKGAISQFYKSKDRLLLTKCEDIEIIDFRVNELRNMPSTVSSLLSDSSLLKTVHFFVIREASVESRMSDSSYQRCRLLEDEPWGKYLLGKKDPDDPTVSEGLNTPQMLIYHWKKSIADKKTVDVKGLKDNKELLNFSALAKFSHIRTSHRQITISIGWVIFFGTVSSLIATAILALFSYLPWFSDEKDLGNETSLACEFIKHSETRREMSFLEPLQTDNSFTSKGIYPNITTQHVCSERAK